MVANSEDVVQWVIEVCGLDRGGNGNVVLVLVTTALQAEVVSCCPVQYKQMLCGRFSMLLTKASTPRERAVVT